MTDSSQQAIDALAARGIDNGEQLLQFGTPQQILAACHRWDSRENVGAGLLARWIRDQEFAAEPPPAPDRQEQQRAIFAEYVQQYPPATAAQLHGELLARAWPEHFNRQGICPGQMIVIETQFPLLTLECDRCGFTAALTPRSLAALNR